MLGFRGPWIMITFQKTDLLHDTRQLDSQYFYILLGFHYFLFIFSWHVKPKLISEKFEAIFVKHFIPWNLTASKRCSSQIGPETPQKILRGAFSMPKSNSKHTRKWWDSFLIFWLGANRLTRTCAYASRFLVLKIIKNWPFLTTNMG